MKRYLRMFAVGLSLLSLVGCASRLTDFTVISTKNVQVSQAKGKRVTGRDCAVFATPNMKEAIDSAVEKANKTGQDYDALVDGVVYLRSWLLFQCIEVEGTPINTRAKASQSYLNRKDLWLHSKRSEMTPMASYN